MTPNHRLPVQVRLLTYVVLTTFFSTSVKTVYNQNDDPLATMNLKTILSSSFLTRQ